ncbi:hypothetical protein [Virgibacillus salexigens]|uniref:hypothetical protein n=1 Tax=Virgibacillus massiliensis TaxID=1462526 RepID=UPI0003FCA930|nr:hypothetical protein [Virgibacillus massiliensis]
MYFNIIFFIVLTSTVIQGTTIPLFAKKLGLSQPVGTNPLHTLDLLSVGKKELSIIEYQVGEQNKINGQVIATISSCSKYYYHSKRR